MYKSIFIPILLLVIAMSLSGFDMINSQTDIPLNPERVESVTTCSGASSTQTKRAGDECTVTETTYGRRALGMCFGSDRKCSETSITGPCDIVLEEQ